MKVLLIGDFSDNFDEGLKNIAKYHHRYLAPHHELRTLDVKRLVSPETASLFLRYQPEIIHYFTAPTLWSLVLLRMLSLRWKDSRSILSALRPESAEFLDNPLLTALISRLLRVDLVVYQDDADRLAGIARRLAYLPNGVDTEKFRPTAPEEKVRLREKYGIPPEKFVFLHVGHLFRRRNLEILTRLQAHDDRYQVVVAGGTYLENDRELSALLRSHGCRVFAGYINDIHEIYAAADCYIFPVIRGNSIAMPLSILEAMSCNLPVISVRYPSIARFSGDGGVVLVEHPDDIPQASETVTAWAGNTGAYRNRELILPYSWENIVDQLNGIYRHLLRGDAQ
jgi:glycosyltransferase involved in cell wall biosynthesis